MVCWVVGGRWLVGGVRCVGCIFSGGKKCRNRGSNPSGHKSNAITYTQLTIRGYYSNGVESTNKILILVIIVSGKVFCALLIIESGRRSVF